MPLSLGKLIPLSAMPQASAVRASTLNAATGLKNENGARMRAVHPDV
jgi:hypothetical protein